MSYIKALIKNLPESNNNSDTSDTDQEVDQEVDLKVEVNKKYIRNDKHNQEKFKALLEAQNQLIEKCLPSNRIDTVIRKSSNNENWKGIKLSLNIDQDNIFVEKNNKKYTFSKKQFLQNKVFKYNLIKSYTSKYGENIWIKIYKEDENFKIYVSRNRNIK
jgi:hypothetical protein